MKIPESLWSDAFVLSSAKAGSGLAGLTYANGKFGWTAMSDADIYEYKVNSGVTAETTSNHADVHLTKEGVNQLYVRYRTLTGDYSDWATFEVYAYSITFDSMGGAGVGKQYKAIGDTVEMPTSERVGYDFAGWYNVAAVPLPTVLSLRQRHSITPQTSFCTPTGCRVVTKSRLTTMSTAKAWWKR